ncbi:hypothetical protein PG987_004985 [Apiospora arundinis]
MQAISIARKFLALRHFQDGGPGVLCPPSRIENRPNDIRRRRHLCKLPVQAGQGHPVHRLGVEPALRIRRAGVADEHNVPLRRYGSRSLLIVGTGNHLVHDAQVARHTRRRADAVVRREAADDQLPDAVSAQERLEAGADEGAVHVLDPDRLPRPRHCERLRVYGPPRDGLAFDLDGLVRVKVRARGDAVMVDVADENGDVLATLRQVRVVGSRSCKETGDVGFAFGRATLRSPVRRVSGTRSGHRSR